jgi:hypothetical protein
MGGKSACIYSPACNAVLKFSLQYPNKLSAIFFTDAFSNHNYDPGCPIYWKVLGIKYHGQLRLAAVRDDTKKIREHMWGRSEVSKLMVVLYRTGDSTPPIRSLVARFHTADSERLTEVFDRVLKDTEKGHNKTYYAPIR